MIFYQNGYILKNSNSYLGKNYLGVEGFDWLFDIKDINEKEKEYIHTYIKDKIDLSYYNKEYVDVCYEIDFLKYLYKFFIKNYDINNLIIILCETTCEKPSLINKINYDDYCFLGYDYAYAGGSFYSCIFNDIINRNKIKINLNEYGLIANEENLNKFIQLRSDIKSKACFGEFEEGDFISYKLWKLMNIDFL